MPTVYEPSHFIIMINPGKHKEEMYIYSAAGLTRPIPLQLNTQLMFAIARDRLSYCAKPHVFDPLLKLFAECSFLGAEEGMHSVHIYALLQIYIIYV